MNVLQICDFAAAYKGSFFAELEEIDSELKRNYDGQNVYALTDRNIKKNNSWYYDLQQESIVYPYSKNIFGKIHTFRKILKENDIDIIHTNFTDMKTDFCVNIASIGFKPKRIKHYRSSFGVFKTLKRFLCKFIYKNWQVIVISEGLKDECKKNYSLSELKYIPNPLFFKRLESFEKLTNSEITKCDTALLFLMFGYNYKIKGVDLAAEAVRHLRKEKNVHLAVVAASHLEETTQSLKNQFDGKIPDWIHLLPPRQDVAAYYNVADLFLAPSRTEGAPGAIIEAAYCKKMVVASNCKGQYGFVNGKLDFIWFESGNANDLAKKLNDAVKIINDEDLLEKNKQSAIKNFSFETYIGDLFELYN